MNTLLRKVLTTMALAAAIGRAGILYDTVDQLVAGDPTQLGRLSRNGIPQDWAGSEPFPGVINPATSYHYTTYSVNVGITRFIQIDVDSNSPTTFFSAYLTSYLPNPAAPPNLGLDTNWLGDAGFSGDLLPGEPLFFNVVAPANSNLIIVVNESASNGGLLQPYHLTVEGFLDAEFTDVPEPSYLLVVAGALAAVVRRARSIQA